MPVSFQLLLAHRLTVSSMRPEPGAGRPEFFGIFRNDFNRLVIWLIFVGFREVELQSLCNFLCK